MRKRRQYWMAMAVTAVVAAGVLAGCGDKEDKGGKVETQTEESAKSQKEESVASDSAAGESAETKEVQEGKDDSQGEGQKADVESGSQDGQQADVESGSQDGQQAEGQDEGAGDAVEKNDVFGEFQTKTLDGEDVDQELFGKSDLTMVNIWGTFCGPCIREMPDLGELSREYADKGFQMVGIISDVSKPGDETALEIVESTEADYTHLVIPKDANMQYRILKNAQVVPTTIFLDKDGNQIGDTYPGAKSKKQWTAIIDEMLGKVSNE